MKIYIVHGNVGEYSDSRTWNVCAFHSEELAKKFAAGLNALVKLNNELAGRLRIEFEEPLEAAYVKPKYPRIPDVARTEKHRLLRKLTKNGKRGTEDEIARWKVAESEYNARIADAEAPLNAFREERDKYYAAKESAREAWIKANWKVPDELAYLDPEIVKNEIIIGSRSEEDAYDYHNVRLMDPFSTW